MNLRRSVGTGAAVIFLVASWRGTGAGVAPDPLPAARPQTLPAPLAVQGAGSCSATACHGSMAPAARDEYPSRVLRNEHTTWITQDRHADAYRVLFSRRSQVMASQLSGGKVPAHQDERCLACHATGGVGPTVTATEVVRQDGVSCESCHGPAQLWLTEHTRYDWNNRSPQEKQQRGMRPTRDLSQRAAICVECHVGSPGRDMNHDLIAAGHPRLNFEFAAFLANMPPHWVEDVGGNFPARVWAIGQATTAKAAVDLLAYRAGHAAGSPWPEFSEYNCFACHHDLAGEQWRQQREPAGRMPGAPAWGTWYYPSALTLARQGGQAELRDLEERFAVLRTEMSRFGADPGKSVTAAQQLSQALARWLQGLPEETRSYDTPKVKALIESVRAKDAPGAAGGWDGAAQRYLALQPLRLALKGLDPSWTGAPLEAELKSLFQSLQFPRGYDSPRRYDPALPFGSR
jgi:Cytochrome c554 and c-prime